MKRAQSNENKLPNVHAKKIYKSHDEEMNFSVQQPPKSRKRAARHIWKLIFA